MNGKYRGWIIDILETVIEHGAIRPGSTATNALIAKHPQTVDQNHSDRQLFSRLIDSLVHEGYLLPTYSTEGRLVIAAATGITLKGMLLLEELKRTPMTWCKQNWFPMVIAAVTVASFTLELWLRLSSG